LPDREDVTDRILLAEAVREAGVIARNFFGGVYKSWDKSRNNPVTEADIAIDVFLKDALLYARPDYGWLSEETEDNAARLNKSRVFVVDPIDGTMAFLRNKPHFTIVGAVVDNGRPVAAAIYNPMTDEMLEAALGTGTDFNGEPAHVTSRETLDGARVVGWPNTFAPGRWSAPWPDMQIETRASIAYRMALVAAGQFDFTLSLTHKHDWDLAAGDLIVHEAGGLTTKHDGTLLQYNQQVPLQRSVVCAGPTLHELLLARTRGLDLN
jgi:myo-inositol-1(or 4)-monophosphatase